MSIRTILPLAFLSVLAVVSLSGCGNAEKQAREPTGRIMKVKYEYDGKGSIRLLATDPATSAAFDLKAEVNADGLSDFPQELDEAKRQLARTAAVTNVFLSLRLAPHRTRQSRRKT
jgi:hypothetical protein